MKKLRAILIFLSVVILSVPTITSAQQEVVCSPACGQGFSCNGLTGICEPTSQASAANPGGGGSGFVALAPIPGLTSPEMTSVVNSATLANFFNNLYKFLIGLAAVLAVIMIIWGGLEISTQDSISKQGAGKEKIQNAIFGLVLVLSPVLVFSIINPSILNLSLNLPALDTKSGNSSQELKIRGTGTVCSGYSEYRSANISVQNYCVDQFGGGWVNVDASCCAGQSSSSACCGLNSSYTAPVETAPTPIPGGEVVYSDASKIPVGSWCYKISTGAVIKSTQFDCGPDQTSCVDLYSTDKNTSSRVITGSCAKY